MNLGVISISVYRSYSPPAWATHKAAPPPRETTQNHPHREEPKHVPAHREPPRSAPVQAPGHVRKNGLQGLLPAGLDTGDIFLAAMLLFLYSESRDEDFLIILVVVGLSMFQKK